MKRIAIIGAGIGSLSAAALLAKRGYHVTVFEKNEQLGGRAGVFEAQGFRFDMGPSWYLMPDVFEDYFRALNEDIHTHLDLIRLDPAYRVFFEGDTTPLDMPADPKKRDAIFAKLEPNGDKKIQHYLKKVGRQYELIVSTYLRRHYRSVTDLMSNKILVSLITIPIMGSVDSYIRKTFHSSRIRQLLSYTLVFLGASPYNAPAFYAMMAHVDLTQGVYYPKGGVTQIIQTLIKLGTQYGATYKTDHVVKKIRTQNGRATELVFTNKNHEAFDIVISNADMQHTETQLLEARDRSYHAAYWKKRVLAPSAILLYLGVKGRVKSVRHHTLYFTKNWQEHFDTIFKNPSWPTNPCYYLGVPSKTDPTVAPKDHENMFVLVPVASGLTSKAEAEAYAETVIDHVADTAQIPDLRDRIVYKKMFGPADFAERYNSQEGTALGLAHTFGQTALFRPQCKSKKLDNLYYVGAGVHPGIGMPVCLISAELVASLIAKDFPC